jgi:DNA-binding XRE family transcriptional regulator
MAICNDTENDNCYHSLAVLDIAMTKGERMPVETIATGCREDILQDLGNRLRALRRGRNLRQLDMASFGLSYKYYQRLESGQVNPTLATLQRLAAAFDVSVHDLFRPDALCEL